LTVLAEGNTIYAMEDLIKLQRETIDQHIRAENAHDWQTVYGTFVQDESVAFYDVIPLHAHFPGLTGVKDFYQAAERAFPDFRIDVWSESDAPGCSLREITISGIHKGDWCGVAGTGRQVKFHLAGVFLFGSGQEAGKIVAERIYFDNETVLQQINGTLDVSAIPSFAPSQRSSGAFV
jgi:predicted ester cyclase